MTREEAIERLKTDIYKYADFTENPNENEFWMAFDLAIKALEQEPTEWEQDHAILKAYSDGANEVLDKIRAEIEQLKLHKAEFLTSDNKVCINSQEVLNVIDKYKAETEG